MNPTRLALIARRTARSLWFRPAAYVVAAVAAIALAPMLDDVVPSDIADRIDADDVDRLLGVLASTMLAVAIFSLGTLVTALDSASQAATPRTRPLLTQDGTAQNAISTFIGAFLFSVLGLAGLSMNMFGPGGRAFLFGLGLLLVAIVVATLVGSIRRLSNMGGVGEVVDLVERATQQALDALARRPFAGGHEGAPPAHGVPLTADRFGAVQLIDANRLCSLAEVHGLTVHLALRVGAQVDPMRELARIVGDPDRPTMDGLRRAFVIADARTFEHDPRWGLLALSEIASRALSPAVNDPGTAIDVIATQTRLLAGWSAAAATEAEPPHPRLFAPPLAAADLLGDAFRAVGRDGAAVIEVQVKLHKALAALAAVAPHVFGAAARALSAECAARSDAAMTLPADRDRVADLRRELGLAGIDGA